MISRRACTVRVQACATPVDATFQNTDFLFLNSSKRSAIMSNELIKLTEKANKAFGIYACMFRGLLASLCVENDVGVREWVWNRRD